MGGGLGGIVWDRIKVWAREAENAPLPDGIAATGAASEPVTLALRHYNVGALHGGQLSSVGGVSRRWRLQERRENTELWGERGIKASDCSQTSKPIRVPVETTALPSRVLTGMLTLLPAVKRAPASKPPSTITVEPGGYTAPMG